MGSGSWGHSPPEAIGINFMFRTEIFDVEQFYVQLSK